MYRAKATQVGESQLEELVEKLDAQDTDALGPCTKGMKMGILEVGNDCTAHSGSNSTVVNVAIVLEEEVVMDNLGDSIKAFILLFGLLYALNIEYPKDLRYTFEAVQKIFVNLGSECTARVQSLKNKLLQLQFKRFHGSDYFWQYCSWKQMSDNYLNFLAELLNSMVELSHQMFDRLEFFLELLNLVLHG
ncbi:uncharacterized protein LOC128318619 isoform X2 [Pangasianodon hypophthalmus]|uniref:uncharacterized protein LOC128318619 isoform X2 n=1 Tax=Pangasianodon hypophthalmus TaxID=310915 RepID=UPI002307F4B0|nr:uncharacterized protein LOC128318619 isoform X2 [Pangasianodon hypophthalmus]